VTCPLCCIALSRRNGRPRRPVRLHAVQIPARHPLDLDNQRRDAAWRSRRRDRA